MKKGDKRSFRFAGTTITGSFQEIETDDHTGTSYYIFIEEKTGTKFPLSEKALNEGEIKGKKKSGKSTLKKKKPVRRKP